MMNKTKYALCGLLSFLMAVSLPGTLAEAAEKQTIYNSPYVTFSPDGRAWTTNAGDADYTWYEKGTMISTGIQSSLRGLETGEHYYRAERQGEVPVGYWRVEYRTGTCIHNGYPGEEYYHGISYGTHKCLGYYYSGWEAYCADCGECITDMYMYMSKEAAESIDYIDLGTRENFFNTYYYLCPNCNNLEQGSTFAAHMCKAISWNQYQVEYDANTSGTYGGYMTASFHMYNNATEYEGQPVTPVTHLTKNSYTRIGYEFAGWNTEPDGSGTGFQDEAEIYNLSVADWQSYNTDTWTETDEGVITLYAQWRPCKSTLQINPNGGAYNGSTSLVSVSDGYGQDYVLNSNSITAPKGYTVFFETNGGKEISPITGTQHFREWSMEQPFNGRLKNDRYYFIAPDGNVDTITANYDLDPITLPNATKPGSSFGGWYYDRELENPAGGPGDTVTPSKDITLYAGWVDLKLSSKDNYTANGGKGAVDLSWTQSDGKSKTYKIYQSTDNITWKQITSSDDIGNLTAVSKNFTYTGSVQSYTVPDTGIYILTAYGAQGGSYGTYKGGYGGSINARVWLTKGEKITYTIGGQNGYNGGGTGSVYGNGGGATTVVSDRQGTLLIAGGGGGASPGGNGGAGGSSASLRADNNTAGVSGQAGGGAGSVGGNAGELIKHKHTEACLKTENAEYSLFGSSYEKQVSKIPLFSGEYYADSTSTSGYSMGCHGKGSGIHVLSYTLNNIPVNGNTSAEIGISLDNWGPDAAGWDNNSRIEVYDQNGTCIYLKAVIPYTAYTYRHNSVHEYVLSETRTNTNGIRGLTGVSHTHQSWQDSSGYHGSPATCKISGTVSVPLPSGTTSIKVVLAGQNSNESWDTLSYTSLRLIGGTNSYAICGYTDGQIISSKSAYGGSNYVNTSAAYDYTQKSGVRAGNGAFSIYSQAIGYVDALCLNDVTATDLAEPDAVSVQMVGKEALDGSHVRIAWQEPKDNGTPYYHVAESYMVGSVSPLCRSNVTKNTLASGIKGYYYLLDSDPSTKVTAGEGSFTEERNLKVTVGKKVQYLHVAAIDRADNMSDTAHIRIEEGDILWKLYTKQLSIDEADNVYPAEQNKTWYARADGRTPFTLRNVVYMDGTATEAYQPNYIIYESVSDGVSAKNIIYTPASAISGEEIRTDAKELACSTEGIPLLGQYPYSCTIRTDQNKILTGIQKFTLDTAADGKAIAVIPIAGADKDGITVFSSYEMDKNNSLTIIADGEAPIISGMELLENRELINRNDGTVILNATASDTLSGVKDFYIEIKNTDNAIIQKYVPDRDGFIKLEITKDEPVFSGDFMVTAYAVDHVGNEKSVTYGATEFSLTTDIERILEPHDPVFQCGESGILTITTYGYADRVEVEFPAEMTAVNPQLDCTFDYTGTPQYFREEKVQFMIPLDTPTNRGYTITVRAYKGGRKLEDFPSLSTMEVDGSILDHLRTRLR